MGFDVTDVGLEKKSNEHELKKHAATIHCSNTLSLLQRKISNALLYHAYKELMVKEEHEITIKQLCKLIGYQGNNHSVIKEGLKGLLSTVIEWNVVSDTTGLEDWTASSILASVSLRGPICLFAYSPRMKQLLHSPSMFGKINLFIQSRFKSSYGLALYENCIRYRGLPYTKWFEMDVFRKLMGVPDGKYTIFRDFKRRVLDKSVEEVNTYSDLIVEPEIGKEGRQVVRVRFALKERAKKTRLGANVTSTEEGKPEELKSMLISVFGLSLAQSQQVLAEYKIDYIQEKILLIENSKNFHQGKIKNLSAYFLSALKNDYQAGKSGQERVVEKKIEESQTQLKLSQEKANLKYAKAEYAAYREKIIDAALSSLSEEEKNNFLQRFFEVAENSINTVLRLQRNKYNRDTVLNSPQIKILLRQFAFEELTGLKNKIISFEKFKNANELKHQSELLIPELESEIE
jgi:plasmid replication initiation protein